MTWVYVLLGLLGATMVLFATWALLVGAVGVISGERFERCPRCGRLGFTEHGARHPRGCPLPLLHLGGHHVPGAALHRLHHR